MKRINNVLQSVAVCVLAVFIFSYALGYPLSFPERVTPKEVVFADMPPIPSHWNEIYTVKVKEGGMKLYSLKESLATAKEQVDIWLKKNDWVLVGLKKEKGAMRTYIKLGSTCIVGFERLSEGTAITVLKKD